VPLFSTPDLLLIYSNPFCVAGSLPKPWHEMLEVNLFLISNNMICKIPRHGRSSVAGPVVADTATDRRCSIGGAAILIDGFLQALLYLSKHS
jgi:hypothetical protein